MKTTLLLLLAVCAAPLLSQDAASSVAAQAQASSESSATSATGPSTAAEHAMADDARPPVGPRQSRQRPIRLSAPKGIPTPSHAVVRKTNRAKQFGSSQVPRLAGNFCNQSSKCSIRSGIAARNGMVQKTAPRNAAVRQPSMFPTTSPSVGDVRHRGPNPPVVGGSGPPLARNTGAINGSRIARKP